MRYSFGFAVFILVAFLFAFGFFGVSRVLVWFGFLFLELFFRFLALTLGFRFAFFAYCRLIFLWPFFSSNSYVHHQYVSSRYVRRYISRRRRYVLTAVGTAVDVVGAYIRVAVRRDVFFFFFSLFGIPVLVAFSVAFPVACFFFFQVFPAWPFLLRVQLL